MGALFDRLCEYANLEAAWRRVRQKNAAGGLDGVRPEETEAQIAKLLAALTDELKSRRYLPIPYAKGAMPKFNEANEWRKLSMPAVRDKIVQQAFVQVTEGLIEPVFLDCSYAYRPGKGAVRALQRVEHIIASSGIKWVATLDIDDFFDKLNHDILIREIGGLIQDKEMLHLADLWLHAGIISARGEWDAPDEGIAQGSVVSPLFSNVYLHQLDRFAIEKKLHYIRYSDNFIILARAKDELYVAYEQIKSFIEEYLKLKLNDNPYPFKDIERGFAFLGVFFSGALRRISNQKETKIFRKINWLTEKIHQHDVPDTVKRINESIEGTRRHYAFIQPEDQFRSFDVHLVKRIKYLFAHFISKGMIQTESEAKGILSGVESYAGKTEEDRRKIADGILLEIRKLSEKAIVESQSAPASEKVETASREKRRQAARNSYLRKISDQAEIAISSQGLFIGKTSGRLVVREQRKNIMEIPFQKLKNLAIHTTGVSLSSDVIYQCSRQSVPITFYNFKGMPCAILQAPMYSLGALSLMQIKAYETPKALAVVKKIILGKARNQINLLKYYLRSRKNDGRDAAVLLKTNQEKMETILQELGQVKLAPDYSVTRDRIFSIEARISLYYWGVMKTLVIPELGFVKRDRYQATDIVNSMLNYGYGILYQRVWQAVSHSGLNPHISYLHAFQNNKPTLIYDLVEEFRQPFVDRALFGLFTKGRRGMDFRHDKSTGFLTKETKDAVTRAVLARLNGLNNYRQGKIKGEEIIRRQVDNFAAYIRDEKNYRPYISGY